jgi:hypothetical protein
MKSSRFFSYAAAIVLVAGGAIWYIISDYYDHQQQADQSAKSQVVMYKNPNCQCCTKWATHMEEAGFTVSIQPTQQMSAVKTNYKVPYDMGSCHTAVVNGYVVEGHVPAKEVKKLLEERPDAIGLAVPGMPVGSPGMEQGNRTEPYDVLLFGENGTKSTFASY